MGPARGQSAASVNLERAKNYPYEIPEMSFALAQTEVLPLAAIDLREPLRSEAIAGGRIISLRAWAEGHGWTLSAGLAAEEGHVLLAYGSNASIEGLRRKLAHQPPPLLLPVARGILNDFDVVYSAHISPYGAVPAALQYSPGTRVSVQVLVATRNQHQLLIETEPNYVLGALDGIDLELELGPHLDSIPAYLTRRGALNIDGGEVALAAVRADHRKFKALTEAQVLAQVRDCVAPGTDVDEFIRQNVRDPDLAERRSNILQAQARRLAYPSREIATN